MWCSWSFELWLCLLNALLAVPQCPLVIAAPVISCLLTVFRGLVAISAHVDLLCQGNVYRSPSVLYSTLLHWPCMWAVMRVVDFIQLGPLHRVFFAQNIPLISNLWFALWGLGGVTNAF